MIASVPAEWPAPDESGSQASLSVPTLATASETVARRRGQHGKRPIRPISVLLADDHALFREPLREWLDEEPDFRVVGEAAGGDEAVRLTHQHRPDLLLLDLAMPGRDGIAVAEALGDAVPETRIVVLTAHDDEESVRRLAGLPISGFLSKSMRLDELAGALRLVHAGHGCFPPTVARFLRADAEPTSTAQPPTPRELDVLRLAAEALRYREIAARLSISERTVHSHVRDLFRKLGVTSRAEMVREARRRGWIA